MQLHITAVWRKLQSQSTRQPHNLQLRQAAFRFSQCLKKYENLHYDKQINL